MIASVTTAFPVSVLKSGTNLLSAKNDSPAIVGPLDLPWASFCLACKSKSNDFINDVIVVVEPSWLIWSVPTSCSKNCVWPKPSCPTTAGKVPLDVELNLVA